MNLSDKELDRLFREAADGYEPDDSLSSWSRLEKNLSGQLPERPPGGPGRFGIRPMVWIPAAVIFAGLSFFFIKTHTYRTLSTLPPSTQNHPLSPATPAAAPSNALSPEDKTTAVSGTKDPVNSFVAPRSPGAGLSADPVTTESAPASASLPIPTGSAPVTDALTRTGSANAKKNPAGDLSRPGAAASTNATRTASIVENPGNRLRQTTSIKSKRSARKFSPDLTRSGNAKKDRSPAGRGDVSTGISGTDGYIAGSKAAGPGNGKRTDNTSDGVGYVSRPEFAAIRLPSTTHTAAPTVKGDETALALKAAEKSGLDLPSRSIQIRRPFTIGLVMGPDYTDGGVTSNQLGNSVGLSLSYYLTRRVSVNTGLLYGVKSYSARGRDFQPRQDPLRTLSSYPHFESANGTVRLFEIPLSLRFDFPIDSRTRLFANAGLSSYLPLKETFTTYFHDQGRVYGWRHINDNPGSHWFAIGHFSGGIERDLGKGLSFQVEPYFNLPFTNVCTGNVKLNTYGVLLSVRFTPVLNRKKK